MSTIVNFQLATDSPPTANLLHRLLYRLVSTGTQYRPSYANWGYYILPEDVSQEVDVWEDNQGNQTHKIPDIIELYSQFDPRTTAIAIDLVHSDGPMELYFGFESGGIDDDHWSVDLSFHHDDLDEKERFQIAIDLFVSLFDIGPFSHGAYRTERQEIVSPSPTEAFYEQRRPVTIYSEEAVDEIGETVITDAPAKEVRRTERGILVVLSYQPFGGGEHWKEFSEYVDSLDPK